MEFSKLSAPSLKELFVQEFESMILSGRIQVGEKLPPERDLAKTMQVSRAVVNTGIAELARKGFLLIKPRIGTFVADYRKNGNMETLISIMNYNGGILREAEIRSLLELRIALESTVLELCIERITDAELVALKDYVTQLDTTDSPKEASQLAFSFQHELAFLSGNTLMPLIFHSFKIPITSLWERFCQLYGVEALRTNTNTLFSAIERRDAKGAVDCLHSTIKDTIRGTRQIYY